MRGYWHSSWDDTLQLLPELLAAYLEFSGVPWRGGTLEPKVKEFIYIAFDVAATHLYRTGLKSTSRTRSVTVLPLKRSPRSWRSPLSWACTR